MNLFALCKANTRETTFLELSKRFMQDELAQVPALSEDKLIVFL